MFNLPLQAQLTERKKAQWGMGGDGTGVGCFQDHIGRTKAGRKRAGEMKESGGDEKKR